MAGVAWRTLSDLWGAVRCFATRDTTSPKSMQKPKSGSCHLYAGRRQGSIQVPPGLIPESRSPSGFDVISIVSTPHQWFACAHLPDPYLPRSFVLTFP